MVTAVCITGIFIYFFFWSRKLKKQQYEEWRSFGKEEEREEITAVITHSFTQKKRFSPQYLYMEIEASIYIPEEKQSLKLKWFKPYTADLKIPKLVKKQEIRAKGNRRQDIFYANQLTVLESARK